MTSIGTISEFLLQAGCQYLVFDLGRGIRRLDSQQFLDIETNKIPHPYPRLGYAWFGLVFWNKQLSHQHYIWFLKLPLDERGLLVGAARNHFLGIVLEALASSQEGLTDQLPEHPYRFLPGQQQLASFNSLVRKALALPKSSYFEQAISYLTSPHEQDWREVPMQGLTDVVANLDEPQTGALLATQMEKLHPDVLHTLLGAMENQAIDTALTAKLVQMAQMHSGDIPLQQACLRALSQSVDNIVVMQHLHWLLGQSWASCGDILIVISGRHWQHLSDEALLQDYLNNLAAQCPELFSPVFADLVRIPVLREGLLKLLRAPQKSETLTQAIGQLFSEQN
ncbi:DUF3549 family protein [Aliiglaciecola sp. CAU 1673]|uniref:DUF3549 family protein n=1 Tax=Aliiglaciecola sp. CAU 1673 TaxID=3032595 RepID=UPI0023DB4798|nr:DUF3549 family protein [Aliiglaciecola sp. CAU 1673]MDF2179632.1 DUF3549 family protein [Aliiglaciecola sp. CAU 1673]